MARPFRTSIGPGDAPDGREGYPGNTNASQDRAVIQLRSELESVGFAGSQDDHTLLRFLRSRSFDVKQAKFRLIDVDKWRKKFGVSSLPPFKKSAERYYHKTDRDGRPLLIVRLKDLDLSMVGNKEAESQYLRNLVSEIEHLVQVRLPACSRAATAGWLIESTRVIIDLDGLKMGTIQRTYGFVRSLVLMLENYPERLHMLYIINPPMGFTTAGLSHIKMDMNPVTARKIKGLGNGYQQALLEAVSEENLPVALGGACKCELGCELSDAGPWQDDKSKHLEVPESKSAATAGEPGIVAANAIRPEATELAATDPTNPEASSPEAEPKRGIAVTGPKASFDHSEPKATDRVKPEASSLELELGASKGSTEHKVTPKISEPKTNKVVAEPKVGFEKPAPKTADPVKQEASSPRSEPESSKVDTKPGASPLGSKPKVSSVVATEPRASPEKTEPNAGKAGTRPEATSPKPELKATEPAKPEASSTKAEPEVSKEQTERDSSSQKLKTEATGPVKPEVSSQNLGPEASTTATGREEMPERLEQRATNPAMPIANTAQKPGTEEPVLKASGPEASEAHGKPGLKAVQAVMEIEKVIEATRGAVTNSEVAEHSEGTDAADPEATEPMSSGSHGGPEGSAEDSQLSTASDLPGHGSALLELDSAANSLTLSIRALSSDLLNSGEIGPIAGSESTAEIDGGEATAGSDSPVSSTGSFDENVTYVPENEQTAEADSPMSRVSEDIPESSPKTKPRDGRLAGEPAVSKASTLPVLATRHGPRECNPGITVKNTAAVAKAWKRLPENWEGETF